MKLLNVCAVFVFSSLFGMSTQAQDVLTCWETYQKCIKDTSAAGKCLEERTACLKKVTKVGQAEGFLNLTDICKKEGKSEEQCAKMQWSGFGAHTGPA